MNISIYVPSSNYLTIYVFYSIGKLNKPLPSLIAQKYSANTKEIIAINFMRILREGPEVSFMGSPTVSPTTAALYASEPLPLYLLVLLDAPINFYNIYNINNIDEIDEIHYRILLHIQ